MYSPHTVTLYNVVENADLTLNYNVTILRGVLLDIAKAMNVQNTGIVDADTATLFIPFSVKAVSPTGASKEYCSPKAYEALSNKSGYWTIDNGGVASSVGCFFVKGEVVDDNGFAYIKEHYDNVFDVTTVDERDFGTADMQHWQVGGR